MLKTTITLLLFVILLNTDGLPRFTVTIIIGIVIGLSARFGYEWGKNTFRWKNSFIRLIYALCLSYLLMSLWVDFDIKKNIIYWIAGLCACSMEVINELLKVIEVGFKQWIRNKVNSFLGKHD